MEINLLINTIITIIVTEIIITIVVDNQITKEEDSLKTTNKIISTKITIENIKNTDTLCIYMLLSIEKTINQNKQI